ncbi:MAG: toll/interleukin-1 receptor domain-containing protein [Pseudomonadota bacterium]
MADIFLSYARSDYDTALKVRDALDPDLTVFWDITGLDAGDVFPEKLETEVNAARVVLGLWNDHALGREWVKREVDIAFDNKTLLPVEIGPVTDRVISARLSTLHRTKLHDFDGSADHPGWQETVKSLAQRLKRPDLIKARKTQVKEEARAKKLEAENKRLRKSKGGLRPWQWSVGGLVSLALAAGAGYWAFQAYEANQNREQLLAYVRSPDWRRTSAAIAPLEKEGPNAEQLLADVLNNVSVEQLQAAAEIDGRAALLAARAYEFGKGGVERDHEKALGFYDLSCKLDNLRGCNYLGFVYDKGYGVDQDYDRALTLYGLACEGGFVGGCTGLGGLYDEGLGVDQDYARAQALYEQDCEGGFAAGCKNLKDLYERGRGLDQEYGRAQGLYHQGCEIDVASGCTVLGALQSLGLGVNQDGRARELYKRGCEGGDANGCSNLGYLYQNGLGVDQDYGRAWELYEQACDGGNAGGCTNLGYLYDEGLGVDQDYGRARELFDQACDGGNAPGCSGFGNFLYRGLGGAEDKSEGLRLLRKGCNGGDQWGCDKLAVYSE